VESLSLSVQVDGHNQAIETQDLRENQHQDHTNEQAWLLSCSSYTSVTDDSNAETSSQASETDSQASTKVDETAGKVEKVHISRYLRTLSVNSL
jgi:hypothetical protein